MKYKAEKIQGKQDGTVSLINCLTYWRDLHSSSNVFHLHRGQPFMFTNVRFGNYLLGSLGTNILWVKTVIWGPSIKSGIQQVPVSGI